MARSPGRVLSFPVSHPPLLDAHEVLVLHFTHEFLRLQRLAPCCSPNEILALHGEWALLASRLDMIEAAIKTRVEHQAKAVGLIA